MSHWVISDGDAVSPTYVYHLHNQVTLYVKSENNAQAFETQAEAEQALSEIPAPGFLPEARED